MRTTLSSVALVAALVAGTAGAAHAEQPRRAATERARSTERTLSLVDIHAKVKPVSNDIGQCYLDAAANVRGAGQLVVQLAIHRTGTLDGVTVQTPGLDRKRSLQIESCVRDVVGALEFPARRTSTTAVVPYFFQHTDAPNAGPQLSCWNPRGCSGR